MILTAAALSTGSVVLIGVGSAAAGVLIGVGSYKIYKMYVDRDNPGVQREMQRINEATRQNFQRETGDFSTRTRQATSQITETTNNLLFNQEGIEYIENLLKKDTESMRVSHQAVQVYIVDLEESNRLLNLALQGYREQKNQTSHLTADVNDLNQKFATLYKELSASASQFQNLQKAIAAETGARDYTAKMIDFIRRMKSDNVELVNKVETLTADYEAKDEVIKTQSAQIAQLFLTIRHQKEALDATKAQLDQLENDNAALKSQLLRYESQKNTAPTTAAFFKPNEAKEFDYGTRQIR